MLQSSVFEADFGGIFVTRVFSSTVTLREISFLFDMLQLAAPEILWASPGSWSAREWKHTIPVELANLRDVYFHFVVPMLTIRTWILVEIRFIRANCEFYIRDLVLIIAQRAAIQAVLGRTDL